MLSCATPTATLQPAQQWSNMNAIQTVKEEATEEMASDFNKDQCNSFFSEGFHSNSPSSSSKDSAAHSPHSVASGGEPSPTLYDAPALSAKMNFGLHLQSFRPEYPYNMLVTPDRRSPNDAPAYPVHIGDKQTESTPSNVRMSPTSETPDQRNGLSDSGFQRSPTYKHEMSEDEGPDSCNDDLDDEPGLRVPAVNSHGKVKTFKCKQCEFVAVTKLSFWEHSKEHIKPDKMLNCPKCPFVTEYKHHLEYHMRNHFGSKPFRCTQCDYSCVNKSMLNSHLKSHSNIYQYRCSDCNYATKYCHSLKLHLRKYQHNPAMVLNNDGTPNPLPIIDVYGTRRGPKLKSQRSTDQTPPSQQPLSPLAASRAPHFETLFRNPFAFNLPYNGFLPQSFLFPPKENYQYSVEDEKKAVQNLFRLNPPTPPPKVIENMQDRPNPTANSTPVTTPIRTKTPELVDNTPTPIPPGALDLSRREGTTLAPGYRQILPIHSGVAVCKNRRKGRAFKLEPEALRQQHSSPSPPPSASLESPVSYECPHCEIVFRDLTMHMIHMGFHGYNEPFMCNKCGERSPDRVSFFIHLGRAQHS